MRIIKLDGITVNYGNEFLPSFREDRPTFNLIVYDNQGNELYAKQFSITYVILDKPMPESFTFEISIPHFDEGKIIKIYDLDGNEVLSIDLSTICDENNTCDNFENYFSCPKDCPSGSRDGVCDKVKDGKCDQDCAIPSLDQDCLQPTTTTTIPLEKPLKAIYSILLGMIVLVLIFLLLKTKVVK